MAVLSENNAITKELPEMLAYLNMWRFKGTALRVAFGPMLTQTEIAVLII
jgi:hypothetical protein